MNSALEFMYSRSPVWLQNVGISLFGMAYRRQRLGGNFDRYTKEFRDRERWPRERLESYVDAELRRTLLRAFTRTRFYADSWGRHGITSVQLDRFTVADLPLLPITSKSDLRARSADFLVAGEKRGRLLRSSSSGSTGTPVTVFYTANDQQRFYAAREARSFNWAGASIRMPRSMIGGRMVSPRPGPRARVYRVNAVERQMYCSAYHIGPLTAADYVAGFNRRRPAVFTGYAYSHYLLARLMLEQNLHLDYEPKALILGSEKLTGDMKTTIRQAFGARAYEEYGASENCVLATECECERLHVHPDFGIVEIVDDAGLPVERGQEGRILCTGLVNRTQLLIRYDIGDRGIWDDRPCPCGRNAFPVLREVVGRLEDVVVGPDGRQLVRFHAIYYDLPNVREGQVVQERLDSIRVRLVAAPGFTAAESAAIVRRVRDRLGDVRVTCEVVPSLERTSRGKLKAVVSLLKAEEREQAIRSARGCSEVRS